MQQACFNCGVEAVLTDDHIPPESWFSYPVPSRDKLIIVKSCNNCNQGSMLHDEALRAFLTSVINRNQEGAEVWKNRVVSSSFKRSPKLRQRMKEHLKSIVPKLTPVGIAKFEISFPEQRGIASFTKMTKGLLSYYYPNGDYSKAKLSITQLLKDPLHPNQEEVNILSQLLPAMQFDERGNGHEFQSWRFISNDHQTENFFILRFYEAATFMVTFEEPQTVG